MSQIHCRRLQRAAHVQPSRELAGNLEITLLSGNYFLGALWDDPVKWERYENGKTRNLNNGIFGTMRVAHSYRHNTIEI